MFTVGSPLDRTGYLMRALHYVYIDGGGEVHSPDHAADIGIVSPGHSAAAPTFDEFVDLVKSLASEGAPAASSGTPGRGLFSPV